MFEAIDRRVRIVIGFLFLFVPNAALADTAFIALVAVADAKAFRDKTII